MKDFIKMVLAVICGVIIAGFVCLFLFFGFVGSFAASSKPMIPKSGVLKIDLRSFAIGEQTKEANPFENVDPVSLLTGGSASGRTIGIWDAVQAVNAAAEDPAVKYIYLLPCGNRSNVSALEELRVALENFRTNSGKPVIAYLESFTTQEYYIASVADKIYLSSSVGIDAQLNGIGTQMLFFGDLLKQFGINVQLIRHGKYKSAGETYTRGSSSPENREQYQRLVDSIWETLGDQIAEARGLTREQLDGLIEGLRLREPKDCLECGLVDELVDPETLEDKLTAVAVADKYKDIKWISLTDYAAANQPGPSKIRQKIAVIYADGEIIDGSAKVNIAGDRFATLIDKVRADSTVKAVVLRVNSPGGSVTASEKIKRALDRLQEDKPIVASYGSAAASGGYWISNRCDKIFSDATTLTGSIGVFGMVPDISKAAKDIVHVGIETVTSHKHGDMYSLTRPLDTAEYGYMLAGIESVYDRFTTIVSEGRGIPKETVDAIGQGRVWTGADGLGINLVDEIGTLEDAVRYAAVAAGDGDLESWNIKSYPTPPSQMEQYMSLLSGKGDEESILVSTFSKFTSPKTYARMDSDIRIR